MRNSGTRLLRAAAALARTLRRSYLAAADRPYPGSWALKQEECPICGRRFPCSSMLNQHLSKAHVYALSKQLEKDPMRSYTQIFGEDNVKRVTSKELRYPGGLVVGLPGNAKASGLWWSFVDNVGGGPIKAIMYANPDLTYSEAVQKGLEIAGLSPDGLLGVERPEEEEPVAVRTTDNPKGRIEAAQDLWRRTVGLKGTPAEKYLTEERRIPAEALENLSFRFLPEGVPYFDYDAVGMKIEKVNDGPALVVPIEDAEGNVTGIQRVFVRRDGGKRKGRHNKLSKGVLRDGAGIVQRGGGGAPGRQSNVVVAEGPETGASIASVVPSTDHVLATLSLANLGNVAKVVVAKNPLKVIVAGDNDRGKPRVQESFRKQLAALEKAVAKLRPGLRVVSAVPDLPSPSFASADWNDVLKERGKDRLREEFRAKADI